MHHLSWDDWCDRGAIGISPRTPLALTLKEKLFFWTLERGKGLCTTQPPDRKNHISAKSKTINIKAGGRGGLHFGCNALSNGQTSSGA
jgi:hypothetical protein